MQLSSEIKQKIIEEYNLWVNDQYNGKSLDERRKLGQFFTPPELTIKMIELMSCDSLWGKTILDPTSGAGGLIAACIIAGADPKLCYCNEYDEDILTVCKKRLMPMGVPEVNIHQGDATNADDIALYSFVEGHKASHLKEFCATPGSIDLFNF